MSQNHNTAIINTPDEWVLLQRQCEAFIRSGFLPPHIKNVQQAVTIAVKGRELGIPPMQAFSSITVISGKPALSAELMLALIYQRVPGAQVHFVETTDIVAKVEATRPGGKGQTFSFTIEDAKQAGLVKPNSPWIKYPAAMLRARVISAMARAVFPDAIMGCYTPEELDPAAAQPETLQVVLDQTKEVKQIEIPKDVLPVEKEMDQPLHPECPICHVQALMVDRQNEDLFYCFPKWGGCGQKTPRD